MYSTFYREIILFLFLHVLYFIQRACLSFVMLISNFRKILEEAIRWRDHLDHGCLFLLRSGYWILRKLLKILLQFL